MVQPRTEGAVLTPSMQETMSGVDTSALAVTRSRSPSRFMSASSIWLTPWLCVTVVLAPSTPNPFPRRTATPGLTQPAPVTTSRAPSRFRSPSATRLLPGRVA